MFFVCIFFFRHISTRNPCDDRIFSFDCRILSNICNLRKTNFLALVRQSVIIEDERPVFIKKAGVPDSFLTEFLRKGEAMKQQERCVILTQAIRNHGGESVCRLIETADPLSDGWIYSLFVTTAHEGKTGEEFVFDISRSPADAARIFQHLCKTDVTADTLHDAVSRLMEASVIQL